MKRASQKVRQPLVTRRLAKLAHRVLLALACSACASPPVVHLHSLLGAERPAPRDGSSPGRGAVILLEPIRVPTQVDQPQWLIRLPDDTLALLEQERWASPVRDELHQALLEILTLRYGAVDARSEAKPASPPTRIRVEVTRFELRPGEAGLEGTWLIMPGAGDAAGLRCTSSLRESAGAGMTALAEAERRAVVRLGDAIGTQLQALQRGEAGQCPA
ncbi:MAG: PqiC family protein [Caldimonas sp.]